MIRPSKKIVALLIIALGVIGSISISRFWNGDLSKIASQNQNTEKTENVLMESSLSVEQKNQNYPDTDEDNLKDWEEALWGTNPLIKDTDGDGSSDGDEIKNKTNPLSADNRNDLLEISKVSVGSQSYDVADFPSGKTDILSRELASKILSLKNQGNVTLAQKEALVNELVSSARNAFSYIKYDRKGLQVFGEDNKNNVRQYASNFAVLQIDFLVKVNEQQRKISSDLNIMAEIYDNLAKNLYEIAVPQVISDEHMKIVNNYSIAASSYRAFANNEKDPALAMTALREYQDMKINHENNIAIIAEYIRNHDIIFTENEAGSWWNNF